MSGHFLPNEVRLSDDFSVVGSSLEKPGVATEKAFQMNLVLLRVHLKSLVQQQRKPVR